MKPKLIAIGLAVAIFASGVVSGVVVDRYWPGSSDEQAMVSRRRGPPERVLARFRKKLDLSEEQERAIADILQRSRGQASEVRNRSQQEIIDILSPEQAAKYRKMIERKRKRYKQKQKHKRGKRGMHKQPREGKGPPPR